MDQNKQNPEIVEDGVADPNPVDVLHQPVENADLEQPQNPMRRPAQELEEGDLKEGDLEEGDLEEADLEEPQNQTKRPAPKKTTVLQEAKKLESLQKKYDSFSYKEINASRATPSLGGPTNTVGVFDNGSWGVLKKKQSIWFEEAGSHRKNNSAISDFWDLRTNLDAIGVLEKYAFRAVETVLQQAPALSRLERFAALEAKITELEKKHTISRKASALVRNPPYIDRELVELDAIAKFQELKGVQKISERMHKHYYAICLAPVIVQLQREIGELQAALKTQGTRADNRYIGLKMAIERAKALVKELKDITKGNELPNDIDLCNPDQVIGYAQGRIQEETDAIFKLNKDYWGQGDFNKDYQTHVDKIEESLEGIQGIIQDAFRAESQKWYDGDFVSGAPTFHEQVRARPLNIRRAFDSDKNDSTIRALSIRNLTDLAMEAARKIFSAEAYADRSFIGALSDSCNPLSEKFNTDRFMDMLTGHSQNAIANELRRIILDQMVEIQQSYLSQDQRNGLGKPLLLNTQPLGDQDRPHIVESEEALDRKLQELHAYAHQGDLEKTEWERRKENAAIAKGYVQHVYKQIKAKSQGKTFDAGHYKMYRVTGMDHHNALNLADYDRNINAILKSFEQGSWERDFSVEGQHKAAQYDAKIRTELKQALEKRSRMLTKSGVAIGSQPDFVCSAGSFATFELTGRRIKMSDLGSLDDTADYKPTVMQSVVRSLHRAVLNLFDTLNALKIWVYGKDSGLTCNQIGRVLGHVKNYQLSRLPTRTATEIESLKGQTLQHQQQLAQTSASLLSQALHPVSKPNKLKID